MFVNFLEYKLKDRGVKLIGTDVEAIERAENRDSFEKIINEPIETTFRRLDQVIASGHHSVFDHFHFTFEIEEIPKIIAISLNWKSIFNASIE